MYWEQYQHDFGFIKEEKKILVVFKAKITIPEIMSIVGSCGCTRLRYYVADKKLEVEYRSGFIPNHLEEQEVNKSITVTYKDGTEEFLYIIGKKIK